MKIIKDELTKNGALLFTIDEPIRIAGTTSIFKDENGIEYITISDSQIQRIQKMDENGIKYPTKINEIGVKYFSDDSEVHDLREIAFEI